MALVESSNGEGRAIAVSGAPWPIVIFPSVGGNERRQEVMKIFKDFDIGSKSRSPLTKRCRQILWFRVEAIHLETKGINEGHSSRSERGDPKGGGANEHSLSPSLSRVEKRIT
jgi:hypothetical protein